MAFIGIMRYFAKNLIKYVFFGRHFVNRYFSFPLAPGTYETPHILNTRMWDSIGESKNPRMWRIKFRSWGVNFLSTLKLLPPQFQKKKNVGFRWGNNPRAVGERISKIMNVLRTILKLFFRPQFTGVAP